MVSQRGAALLVFVGIVMLGLAAGLVIRSSLRERRWRREGEELAAYLTELSDEDVKDPGLTGVPAVLLEKENESTYVDEPAKEASIVVNPLTPRIEIMKRMWLNERAREKLQAAQKDVATSPRGVMILEERPYLMTNWRMVRGRVYTDLMAEGRRMGVLELTGRTEKVLLGSVHLSQDGKLVKSDVFIPVQHPNRTNLFESVLVARPLNRELAVDAILASYNLTPASKDVEISD